jgi:NTE family protein
VFLFNAANVTTGVRFSMERATVGDWVIGYVASEETKLRVADAVAASAAVPGAFPPLTLRSEWFPCSEGRRVRLLDGGAYDNMGLEPIDDLPRYLVVALNAGGVFRTRGYGKVPIIRDLARANSVLYRQSTALRMRDMTDRFRAWERARKRGETPPNYARQGVLFSLATSFQSLNPRWSTERPEAPRNDDARAWRLKLATTKTSFGRFSRELAHDLVYRGWWLAGAGLSKFHEEVLAGLPEWRPL